MTNHNEGDIPVAVAVAFAYPPPPTSYPPQMVPPPPIGYPGNEDGHKALAIETSVRGEGFWKGCVAALCCCWVLECCCDG